MSKINVILRDAATEDVPALSQVHVRAFDQTHGPGPDVAFRERQWRGKLNSPDALLFCIVLEAPDSTLIGFASGKPHRAGESPEYRGVLDKIYLLQEYHRQGFGRLLLCAAAQRFVARGIDSMLLFGDAMSPTNGFYEAMAGERLYGPNGEFHGAYGWRDLRQLAMNCPDHPFSA